MEILKTNPRTPMIIPLLRSSNGEESFSKPMSFPIIIQTMPAA
jgi:hypothetical protein